MKQRKAMHMSRGKKKGGGVKKGIVKSAMNSTRTGAFQIRLSNPRAHDVLIKEKPLTAEDVQQELKDFKEASVNVQQELDNKVEELSYDVTKLTEPDLDPEIVTKVDYDSVDDKVVVEKKKFSEITGNIEPMEESKYKRQPIPEDLKPLTVHKAQESEDVQPIIREDSVEEK
jgi:hypothetical protein